MIFFRDKCFVSYFSEMIFSNYYFYNCHGVEIYVAELTFSMWRFLGIIANSTVGSSEEQVTIGLFITGQPKWLCDFMWTSEENKIPVCLSKIYLQLRGILTQRTGEVSFSLVMHSTHIETLLEPISAIFIFNSLIAAFYFLFRK